VLQANKCSNLLPQPDEHDYLEFSEIPKLFSAKPTAHRKWYFQRCEAGDCRY